MSDNSGIEEEWLAETGSLLKQAYEAKDLTPVEIILSSSPFFKIEETAGKIKITGIALAEGIWKNVLYPAEELQKAAEKLKGKPLLVEHGQNEHFKKIEVGQVTLAQYDPMLKSIVFQADVTNLEAIAMVKDGTFPAVSCSTWLDKYPVNRDQAIGFNFKFNELSLVQTPACEKCFIFAVEQLSKHLKEDGNDHSHKEMTNLELGEEKMNEENNNETIEELEEDFDLSELEKPNLYAVLECDTMEELGEDLKKKAVSYYYGYKYPAANKAKYPYPKYPNYPYGPQGKKGKCPAPQKKSLFALILLDNPEEITMLQQAGRKIISCYYGYYGYPYGNYPYYEPYTPEYGPQYDPTGPPYQGQTPQKQAAPVFPAPDAKGNCPKGFTLDPKDNKCKPVPAGQYPAPPQGNSELEECPECDELLSTLEELAIPKPYLDFMRKCMKESKTMPVIKRMKECAAAYKAQVQKKSQEDNASPEMTDMEKEIPKVTNGPTLDAAPGTLDPTKDFDEQAKETKLNKAEILSTTPVTDMTEPCKDCPKKEETGLLQKETPVTESKEKQEPPKVETPPAIEHKVVIEIRQPEVIKDVTKEAPKVETPKAEEPKVVTPVEEPKKEEVPKAEPPKTEAPKAEEKPQLTPEEVEKYVKENYPEVLLEMIKRERKRQ